MSADEIDAELLALAGDDSDDDGESVEEPQQVEARSPSQEPKPSVEKTEEAPQNRRGVAQKVRKRGRKKATRRELEDELDDLRDDSPSPTASVGSGDMAHSDSEADAPASSDNDDGPLFPLENKFLSASDRDHILSLPEIQREEILAERAQEVLKRQQDLQLKKTLAAAQATASKHKRKAAAAELDDGPRKTSRPKSEKQSALDDYKKAREAKGSERTSRIDRRADRKDDRSPSASGREASVESEVEWAEPVSASRRDEPPADLKDFEHCRIGRSNFAKVCFYPNFESVIKGCFCRVSIGLNRETKEHMYRMSQIKGFTEGKPYQLEGSNGKHFMTDQYVLLAYGNSEKSHPFSFCSDGRFTDLEFQGYKDRLEKEHVRLPRKPWLHQKLDDIHKFLEPQWDETTLQAKLGRQRAMEDKFNPTNQYMRKRDVILKRKNDAQENDDMDEVARCEEDLIALDNDPAYASIVITPASLKIPDKGSFHQERLARLNQANRERNAVVVRRALIEERKKLQKERAKKFEESNARVLAARETQRQAMHLANQKEAAIAAELFGDTPNISRDGTPMSGADTPKRIRSRPGTPANGVKKDTIPRSGIGLVVKKRMDQDDSLADLDLGIDVEI